MKKQKTKFRRAETVTERFAFQYNSQINSRTMRILFVELWGAVWQKFLFYIFFNILLILPIAVLIDIVIFILYPIAKYFFNKSVSAMEYSGKKLLKIIFKSFLAKVVSITAVVLTVWFFINLFITGQWRDIRTIFEKMLKILLLQ